ncbi:hypothetical protein K8640_02670 [Myxococcus sp. XM-1-1-1]|uniref:hypothetical protein n=1 Tax=Myxococcus sp. XM-1-1-1 TaxID=2874602 RepID=UPI001CBCB0B7|nr:hypothetical protein [Myxococcus sp. XM-1-1-1]MBZ4407100.1 hypothetical protein [Myxococcus sp. XM-1-1-1]BDT36131.1 hypothetical protein MFMH1_58000 [Myxococcus sp. MH1]
MWAPEERGAGGGSWGALAEGEGRELGGGRCRGGASSEEDEPQREARDAELLLDDDLDFQIASY